MKRLTLFLLSVWVTLAGGLRADAQPVTTLFSFQRGPINPHAGLTLGNDGNFYGTTAAGGRNLGGTLFRVTTNGVLTLLFSFQGYSSGSGPTADLTLGPDGYFYGTTTAGGTTLSGTNDTGVVFKVNTNGIPTTVVNFNGTNGGHPDAAVTLGPDGDYYGTTEFSGANNVGTVFKVTTNGVLTTLVTFNTTNGANPVSSLTLSPGGTFYGTTKLGGQFGLGTAFKLTTNGGFTMLGSFDQTNGAWPAGRMTLGPDGNLYGTTAYLGTAFKMTTNGAVTTLVDFNQLSLLTADSTTNGEFPYSGLTLGPDGNFYGTTSQGGTNGSGTIFRVSTNGTLAMLANIPGIQIQYITNGEGVVYYTTNNFATIAPFLNGTFTQLYSFSALSNSDNGDGADPESDLTLGPDGNFYGTTVGGGTHGAGAVFKISPDGTFTALASLPGDTGYNPYAGVTAGPGGSLYGVVTAGGTTGYGTAFEITAGGQYTLLDNFSYFPNGANPQASLIAGPDGNFYGTAVGGGTNLLQTGPGSFQAESFGTAFKLATNGALTMLAYFNGTNGANPYGGLAYGPDGNFYGTTAYGGISNNGVVFQLLTNGTLNALTNFTGANGANPYEGLTLGPDNNFYGTTEAGGSSNDGTVFQVTPAGALKTLVNFNGTNGANPNDGLMVGRDGNLYGTTYVGGAGNFGSVFKVSTGGALTTLYSFVQTNFGYPHGEYPVGGLAQGPDGYLYGTTVLGGLNNYQGTLFKITTNGALTTLYSFVIPNGNEPFATLTLQTNSHFIHFYGTTIGDGSDHPGTVFRVNLTTSYAIAENTAQAFLPLTNEVVWTTGGTLGVLTASGTNGTAQVSGPAIAFAPATNFTGTATISYTVTDNAGGTNTSFITILVTNIPPVANPDFYTVAENSSADVLSPLTNDQLNTSGGVLSLVSVSATNGTAVISGTNVLFTPTANFTGTATIGYTITDNVGGTNTSQITVTVINSSADLGLIASESPNPINASNLLTYTFMVSNAGPATATDVTVSNALFTTGSQFFFNSATGGSTPTNGILLINLGTLAPGATNVAQMTAYVRTGVQTINYFTNTFQVYGDQADPAPANNFATVTVEATNPVVEYFTTSTAEYDTTNTTTVSQSVTNYTTELIAKLPDGTVVYDQSFAAAFSNVTVQAAIATAAKELTNAGAAAYAGPAQTGFSQTTNATSVTVNGGTNINVVVGVKSWVGPVTFNGGNFGMVTGYSFDAVITNYAIPTGGNPVSETLSAGQTDIDTRILSLFDFLQTTTNTVAYTNSAVYVMTGLVAQADLVLTVSNASPVPTLVGNYLQYDFVISNAGPSMATGVIFSNQLPASVPYGGAARTNGPLAGLQSYNLGTLDVGGIVGFRYLIQPPAITGKLTNLFRVYGDQTDPVPANNSITVISPLTNAPVLAGVPGSPYAGGWMPVIGPAANRYENVDFDSSFFTSLQVSTAAGSYAAGFSPLAFGVTASNAIPGDLILLLDPTGGNNPTNWQAVVRFFNPADPTGSNHLAATETQAFIQPDFSSFKLFTNAAYYPSMVAGGEITATFTEIGPMAGVLPGQIDVVTITVTNANADLSLSASVAPEPVGVNGNLVYNLTVSNAGPATAYGMTISNGIPAGTVFSSSAGGYVPSNGVLYVDLPVALPAGATTSAQVTIQPTATGKVTNVFQVYANGPGQPDPIPTNNFITLISTVTNTPVAAANLFLILNNESAVPARVGDFLVYNFSISNAGPSVATGVIFSNQLPASVPFGGVARTNGPLAGQQVYNLGSIGVGNVAIVPYLIQPPAITGKLTNVFRVYADQTNGLPANNFLTVVSQLTNAPENVGLPGTPYAGSWVPITPRSGGGFYENLVYNSTFFSAIYASTHAQSFGAGFTPENFDAPPTNAIPGDLVLLLDANGGHNPTNWLAVVRFFNPADPTGGNHLAATESQAFFPPSFSSFQLFPNTAYVTGSTNDGLGVAVLTVVGPAAGITPGQVDIVTLTVTNANADLSLSAAPEPVGTGSNLVYSLTFSNAGPTDATDVIVSNRIPIGVNFVSATGGATPVSGTLILNLGSLAAGATGSAQVTVQPTATGKLTNSFQIFADQTDPLLTNNLATTVSTVTNEVSIGMISSTSEVEFDTFLTTNLNQRATNYSTELIAKLPDGTVVYDQTFPAAYADPTVQTGITTAAGDLSGDGSSAYTGPTRTSQAQTLANVATVTITNGINTTTNTVTSTYPGPQTIETGNFGVYQRFTGNGAYTGPTGGNPQPLAIASGSEDLDSFTTNVLTYFRTQTTTSNYLNSSVYVMTGVVAQADVALSLQAAPNPVTVGAPLTYSLTVTNNSSTTATGVTVSNTLPGNVSLISVLPSQGSTSTNGGEVTYDVGSLPNGTSATLAIVVVPGAAGLLTNIASASSTQTDSQPANNNVTNVTTAVSEPITNLVLTVLSSITLNPQTGLFEQQIQVSNGGPATPSSVLVFILGLPTNAKLYNATGTTNGPSGVPYVQSTAPLGVGSNVVFLLEYYVPTRVAPTNLSLLVAAGPAVTPPVVNGTILNISQSIVRGDGSVLVEFNAVAGQMYAVQYSSDMMTWRTAVPAITAPANQVQWIDAGPPKTDSSPASQPQRFYRVVHLNGQ